LLLLALLASFPPASRGERSTATRPGANVPANSDTITDAEFAKKVVEVFRDCQQVQAGMTRGELVKLDILDEDFGPLHPVADKSFRQHAKFEYRSCSLIKVDVDFGPTASEQKRPTDVITKVSMPYIDARPKR
jgi:hypothetical protein